MRWHWHRGTEGVGRATIAHTASNRRHWPELAMLGPVSCAKGGQIWSHVCSSNQQSTVLGCHRGSDLNQSTDHGVPFYIFIATLVIVCVAMVAYLFGQASIVSSPTFELPREATPTSAYVANLQIIALENQLEENRSYNDRLVQIVLWSLGSVLALAGLLVGANIFTSHRATQQERNRLEVAERSLAELQDQSRALHKRSAVFALDSAIHRAHRYSNDDDLPGAISAITVACEPEKLRLVVCHG